jgi:hypothetical protein
LKCSSCGLMMSDLDKQCPRCKSPNPAFLNPSMARREAVGASASGGGAATATAAPPVAAAAAATPAGLAVYTQCAWQRPDGRWLNSKEVAEIEQLAQKYVIAKRSEESSFTKLAIKMGMRKGSPVEKIRERVTQIGIPFGIFQAYANSLR